VMEFHHHTPVILGNGPGAAQKSVDGNSFGISVSLKRYARKDNARTAQDEYLYSDGSHHHFMNSENYEQVALTEEELGDAAQWLMPGLKIEVEFYDGTPIGVALPASMELTVTRTDPNLKGATASNSNKPPPSKMALRFPFLFRRRRRKDPRKSAEARYIERVNNQGGNTGRAECAPSGLSGHRVKFRTCRYPAHSLPLVFQPLYVLPLQPSLYTRVSNYVATLSPTAREIRSGI